MSRKWGYRAKRPPAGWDYIEPTMTALANELREANTAGHGGKQRHEAMWPVHQINNQRSRYVYDMFYVHRKISRELYQYCLKNKLADADLIAKWKKPGYEKLCSTFVINSRNFPFGTTAICRVPRKKLQPGKQMFFEAHTGCRGCASGRGSHSNIFGNKYGQNLADVQLLREQKLEQEFGAGGSGGSSSSSSSSGGGSSGAGAAEAPAGPWASMDSSSEDEEGEEEESEDGDSDDAEEEEEEEGDNADASLSSAQGTKRPASLVEEGGEEDEGPSTKRHKQ
jgi:bud site selection protein 31